MLEVAYSVETGRALVQAGLHPASGGEGTLACSGDMLMQALVACAGETPGSVAANREMDITTRRISAEASFTLRGTIGIDRELPVGFRAISLRLGFDTRRGARADHHADGPDQGQLRRLPDARSRRAVTITHEGA